MPNPEQTLLEKRLGWFSNHRVFSVMILVAIFVAGLATFTESTAKLLSIFRPTPPAKLADLITCTIRVSNSGPVSRAIEPFSEFSLVQSNGAMMRVMAEGRVELVPVAKSADQFTIPVGGFRDFRITMPRLAMYEAILEQGGANLHIPIHPTDTREIALASTMFQRSALQRYFASVDISEAKVAQP